MVSNHQLVISQFHVLKVFVFLEGLLADFVAQYLRFYVIFVVQTQPHLIKNEQRLFLLVHLPKCFHLKQAAFSDIQPTSQTNNDVLTWISCKTSAASEILPSFSLMFAKNFVSLA